jgi:hypothetical protein
VAARVVRLEAVCDLETEDDARRRLAVDVGDAPAPPAGPPGPSRYVPLPGVPVLDPRGIHVTVAEHAVLADGRRLLLHADRGFTLGGGTDPWEGLTAESLVSDVLATVLPDDAEETGEDHPWAELAGLLRAHGVEAFPDELRGLPYDVGFTDRLRARLAAG